MATTTDYIPPAPTAALPRLFNVFKNGRYGGGFVFEAYVNATHAAEWLIDGKSRRAFINDLTVRTCGVNNLPLGDPDWHVYRVTDAYAAIPGDVIGIRCTWPSERELAL